MNVLFLFFWSYYLFINIYLFIYFIIFIIRMVFFLLFFLFLDLSLSCFSYSLFLFQAGGFWGDYRNCDTPRWTLESLLHYAREYYAGFLFSLFF